MEVADQDQGELACSVISSDLRHIMAGFPEGEIVAVNVDHFEPVNAEEQQRYFDE